jgi:hypothetical protein
MPMPRWWGHLNKRVFNPRAIASGKWPVLTHVGRTSGQTYHTPLDAHPVDNGYLFVLVGKNEAFQALSDDVSRPPKMLRITEFLRMDLVAG